MNDIFAPHGSNPLSTVSVVNPQACKIQFDRVAKANILVMEGELMNSRLQLPKDERGGSSSLQLHSPILVLQISIPSTGAFAVELCVSHSASSKAKLTAGTYISSVSSSTSKGMPYLKLPIQGLPRNSWIYFVLHIGGVFQDLFSLSAPKWIDSITLAGSVRLRKISASYDGGSALGGKGSGMLLHTVPNLGYPIWKGVTSPSSVELDPEHRTEGSRLHNAVVEEASAAEMAGRSKATPPQQQSSTAAQGRRSSSPSNARSSAQLISVRLVGQTENKVPTTRKNTTSSLQMLPPEENGRQRAAASGGGPCMEEQGLDDSAEAENTYSTSPVKMHFTRRPDGTISFSAVDPSAEAARKQALIDAEMVKKNEEIEEEKKRQEIERFKEQVLRRGPPPDEVSYVRIVDAPAATVGPVVCEVTGRILSGPPRLKKVPTSPTKSPTSTNVAAAAALGTKVHAPVAVSLEDALAPASWVDEAEVNLPVEHSSSKNTKATPSTKLRKHGVGTMKSPSTNETASDSRSAADQSGIATTHEDISKQPQGPKKQRYCPRTGRPLVRSAPNFDVPEHLRNRKKKAVSQLLLQSVMTQPPAEVHPCDAYVPLAPVDSPAKFGYGVGDLEVLRTQPPQTEGDDGTDSETDSDLDEDE